MYWGFDIGVLWASFHAFGHSPPGAVLVLDYSVGTLAKPLPFPGGIGRGGGRRDRRLPGVRGVGRYVAVLAVLGYRTMCYRLPAVPRAIAYWRLRGQFRHRPADDEPRQAVLSG